MGFWNVSKERLQIKCSQRELKFNVSAFIQIIKFFIRSLNLSTDSSLLAAAPASFIELYRVDSQK